MFVWANKDVRSLSILSGFDKFAKKTVLKKGKVLEDVGGCRLCAT